MGGVGGRLLEGLDDDLLDVVVGDGAGRSGAGLVRQPLQATGDEPGPPLAHRGLVDAQPLGDLVVRGSLDAGQHDATP